MTNSSGISDQARQAQEAARRTNGRFGPQDVPDQDAGWDALAVAGPRAARPPIETATGGPRSVLDGVLDDVPPVGRGRMRRALRYGLRGSLVRAWRLLVKDIV